MKKNFQKLQRVFITDKNGKRTQVYIDPTKYLVQQGKLVLRTKIRGTDEKKRVTKSGKVLSDEEEKQKRISKYPLSWKLMNEGKWKKIKKVVGEGDEKKTVEDYQILLKESQWKALLAEHAGLIHTIARKYSYGMTGTERFKELLAVAKAGYIEGINKYGKIKDQGIDRDINIVASSYAMGRVKEAIANQMNTGIRLPSELQFPFQQFKKVYNFLKEKYGRNPKEDELAEHLSKLWNKKTFYNSYRTAEERTYGEKPYKGKDEKKGYVGIKLVHFSDLSPAEQKKEKAKDKLPLEGYISINKQGVAVKKDDLHKKRITDIQAEGKKLLQDLQKRYKKTNTRTVSEIGNIQTILENLQKRVVASQKKMEELFDKRSKKIYEYNSVLDLNKKKYEDISLKERAEKSYLQKEIEKKVPKSKEVSHQVLMGDIKERLKKIAIEKEKISNRLGDLEGEAGRAKYLQKEQDEFYNAKTEWEKSEQDLNLAKKTFKQMDKEDFDREKENISAYMQAKLNDESKRYSGDMSSTTLLGVKQRIKEFIQILSAKEIPLNIDFEHGDNETKSPIEVISNESSLGPAEIMELRDTHQNAKKIFVAHINSELKPVYAEVAKMQFGLHENSKPTPDKLWGELATNKEIVRHLEKKHNIFLQNQEKFVKKFGNIDSAESEKISGTLPFISEQYKDNIKKFSDDYKSWEQEKPKKGKTVKSKIESSVYRQKKKKWLAKKKIARKIWKVWRKKNRDLDQETSKKKYMEIKKKLKATSLYKPKRFEKKILKPNSENIKNWQAKKPKLFIDSGSGRERWVSRTLDTANSVLRRTIPTNVIRDLQTSHNKLVNDA